MIQLKSIKKKEITKKEYVKDVLKTVKDLREPAKGFLFLMEKWMFQTDEAIDWFVTFLSMAIKEALKSSKQKELQESLKKLQKLQNDNIKKSESDNILDNI